MGLYVKVVIETIFVSQNVIKQGHEVNGKNDEITILCYWLALSWFRSYANSKQNSNSEQNTGVCGFNTEGTKQSRCFADSIFKYSSCITPTPGDIITNNANTAGSNKFLCSSNTVILSAMELGAAPLLADISEHTTAAMCLWYRCWHHYFEAMRCSHITSADPCAAPSTLIAK